MISPISRKVCRFNIARQHENKCINPENRPVNTRRAVNFKYLRRFSGRLTREPSKKCSPISLKFCRFNIARRHKNKCINPGIRPLNTRRAVNFEYLRRFSRHLTREPSKFLSPISQENCLFKIAPRHKNKCINPEIRPVNTRRAVTSST